MSVTVDLTKLSDRITRDMEGQEFGDTPEENIAGYVEYLESHLSRRDALIRDWRLLLEDIASSLPHDKCFTHLPEECAGCRREKEIQAELDRGL